MINEIDELIAKAQKDIREQDEAFDYHRDWFCRGDADDPCYECEQKRLNLERAYGVVDGLRQARGVLTAE